ncbi:sensor histidine kinase [Methylobacterium frigidaeris]|uniref:histidine kinase n=1 Tax=Methylobacterium frigidaeris TaxID=2038277 RepID=A0AA37HDV0_9HYPH|nr:ATP-binding protein [Methylobacterium frigidaeris]PIK74386.1 two-component sensor histidine kinase [Methylobacterium frigidaeris]GJD63681.1 Adaptive-response sensory-kinase SasA [Methylobacterium frigidaeris]
MTGKGPLPGRIAGQLALLVVAAIVVTHVVVTVAFILLRPELRRSDERPNALANRLVTVVHMVAAAPAEDRADVVAAARHSASALHLTLLPPDAPDAPATPGSDVPEISGLRAALGAGYGVAAEHTPAGALHLRIAGPGGLQLTADLPPLPLPHPPLTSAVLITLVFLALSLTLLSIWATRALTAPLARLAEAAEAFGTATEARPLPQRGPEEVLAVSRALGRMRDRVLRLIDDRTHMLAAISHDLRTPITRLRLRAEFLEDESLRRQFLRDLDQMNALVEAALSFVRDGQSREGQSLVDLASVVQTVCDGFADIGEAVRAEDMRPALVRGSSGELQRALTNLIDNAVKYAGGATVRLVEAGPGRVAVEILDEGPGIPEEERALMLQPFVRGDRARTLNEAGGFGLGLSIASAIAQSHGGTFSLENRIPQGLCVRLELPRAAGAVPRQPAARAA